MDFGLFWANLPLPLVAHVLMLASKKMESPYGFLFKFMSNNSIRTELCRINTFPLSFLWSIYRYRNEMVCMNLTMDYSLWKVKTMMEFKWWELPMYSDIVRIHDAKKFKMVGMELLEIFARCGYFNNFKVCCDKLLKEPTAKVSKQDVVRLICILGKTELLEFMLDKMNVKKLNQLDAEFQKELFSLACKAKTSIVCSLFEQMDKRLVFELLMKGSVIKGEKTIQLVFSSIDIKNMMHEDKDTLMKLSVQPDVLKFLFEQKFYDPTECWGSIVNKLVDRNHVESLKVLFSCPVMVDKKRLREVISFLNESHIYNSYRSEILGLLIRCLEKCE